MKWANFVRQIFLVLLFAAAATAAAAQQPAAAPAPGAQTGVGKVLDLKSRTLDLTSPVQDTGSKAVDLAVKETPTEIRIELAADVLFDFDKASIKPIAADALHKVAGMITDHAGASVRIEGYTDAKGSDPYNMKLSQARANSVKTWLATKEKLKKTNFTTLGFGAKNPVAPNTKPDGSDDPDGRQKNRRVEIIIKKS